MCLKWGQHSACYGNKAQPNYKQQLKAVDWGPPTHLGVGREKKKGEKLKNWKKWKEKEKNLNLSFFLSPLVVLNRDLKKLKQF